jgi:NAD(P)-dependent dehydrogenase (short-subunit alcohol dehydrogenase family)
MTSPVTPLTVVTGANSGIGRATAVHLATRGHHVVGTVRSLDKAAKLQTMAAQAEATVDLVEMDVADDDSVRRGFAEIDERFGRVDHLVNNAGVGGNAVVEECTVQLFEEVMNVNLNGAVRCLQAVLPQMRARGAGTIVNVSSVVGRIGALAQAPYTASKWALEAVSEELAQEVAPFGIRVAIIEPGVTRSAIFAKNIDTPNTTGAYERQYGRMFQMYAAGIANATDPFEVAEVIHHAIHTDQPKLRYPVSWGSAEIIAGRTAISDEQWVEIGAIADDAEYAARFSEVFGVDITTD